MEVHRVAQRLQSTWDVISVFVPSQPFEHHCSSHLTRLLLSFTVNDSLLITATRQRHCLSRRIIATSPKTKAVDRKKRLRHPSHDKHHPPSGWIGFVGRMSLKWNYVSSPRVWDFYDCSGSYVWDRIGNWRTRKKFRSRNTSQFRAET